MALSPKRKGRITGSSIGAILGLSPFATPDDVMRSMVRAWHGAESEFKGNVATEYGSFHEDYALAEFELATGLDVLETGNNEVFHIHPEYDWLGATPDGRIPFGKHAELLEIKCPYGKRSDKEPVFKTVEEQPHYHAQMQYEMFCSQVLTKVNFMQWNQYDNSLVTVEYDQAFIDETLPKLKLFYGQYLLEREENYQQHLDPLILEIPESLAAEEYKLAKADFDTAKKQMDLAKTQLVKMANGKKANIAGLSVYPINRAGSISYAKVVADHLPDLDLESYRGKASTSWGIK
jgi:putative phage-type endonuclease